MPAETQTGTVSKTALWTGYIMSALPALMLLMSGVMKFMPLNEDAVKGLEHIGWSSNLVAALGIVELVCVLLYILPRTAVLGAILLTGYLGGAIATHVRVGDVFLIQAILGMLLWGGLYLRDPRLRALIPWRK